MKCFLSLLPSGPAAVSPTATFPQESFSAGRGGEEEGDEEEEPSRLDLLKRRLGLESLEDEDLVRLIERMHGAR